MIGNILALIRSNDDLSEKYKELYDDVAQKGIILDVILDGRDEEQLKDTNLADLGEYENLDGYENYTLGDLKLDYHEQQGALAENINELEKNQKELIKTAKSNYNITKALGFMKGQGKSYNEIMNYAAKLDNSYFRVRTSFTLQDEYENFKEVVEKYTPLMPYGDKKELLENMKNQFEKDSKNKVLNQNLKILSEQYMNDINLEIAETKFEEINRKIDILNEDPSLMDGIDPYSAESPEVLWSDYEDYGKEIEARKMEINKLDKKFIPNDYSEDKSNDKELEKNKNNDSFNIEM